MYTFLFHISIYCKDVTILSVLCNKAFILLPYDAHKNVWINTFANGLCVVLVLGICSRYIIHDWPQTTNK